MATFTLNQNLSSASSTQPEHFSELKTSFEKSKGSERISSTHNVLKETFSRPKYHIETIITREDDEILNHQSDDETNYESNGSSSAGNPDLKPSSPLLGSLDDFVPIGLATEVEPDGPEREFFIRTVVIGTQNVGKYTLINSCFSDPGSLHTTEEKPQVDLIMKTAMSFNDIKKYHFWMRTLNRDDSEIKEILWKTYYKWASAFIFVYDTTDEASFKALDRAVRAVQRVVPKEGFFGILVGTKTDLADQRAVSSDDALNFKQRHNFTYFIETSSAIEESAPQLLPRIDTKMKLTFEAI